MEFVIQSIVSAVTGYGVSSAVVMMTPETYEGKNMTTIIQLLTVGGFMSWLSTFQPGPRPDPWAQWAGMSVGFMVLTNAFPTILDATNEDDDDDDDSDEDNNDTSQLAPIKPRGNPMLTKSMKKKQGKACCYDCSKNRDFYFDYKKNLNFMYANKNLGY